MEVKWMMEDEEMTLELFEAFREARDEIDRCYKRGGDKDQQAVWVRSMDSRQFGRWIQSHNLMYRLEQELDDDVGY